ncbi:type VI secretion system-associated FHA domain protein [Xenorhabdus kozodoii]|nr:type VI secretion system-associated FHA domain protein [Xenorhabdus kozodoii]
MRFTIVKNSGSSQPPQLSCDFSPPGGTIGRSTENNWYLPDEEQAIARLQVIVSISVDGECRINNQGAASDVLLNMIPLAPKRQVEVRDGDRLNIGNYQIQIIDIKKNSSQQFPNQVTNTGYPPTPSEIWDDLEQAFPTPDDLHQDKPDQIKQELDENNPLVTSQYDKERNPIDPLAQIEATTDLDALQLRATDPIAMFNSDTTFQQEDILNNHTPTTLLPRDEQYHDQDDNKQEVDPLALFSDKHIKPAPSAKNDDLLNQILDNAVPLNPVGDGTISKPQPFSNPFELFEPPETPPEPIADQNKIPSSDLPPLFATETIPQEPVKTPKSDPIEPRETKKGIFQNYYQDQDIHNHQDAYENQASNVKLEGALLAALVDGMGLKEISRLQFDEQHMYQLGLLVRQLTQGIVTLNTLRTQLKHEANAAEPQFLPDANNPFKLLPSGQSILALMLGNHLPGFMPLEQATRDILIELQAHQLGMIAGMRAITADILHSFHPAILEQKAREDDCLSRLPLLSSSNKASMWEYLIKYYQKTAKEFEQDPVLFGENFLQAYEKEVNRYKNSQS